MDEILSEPPVRGPSSAKRRHLREQHWPIGATLLGVRERSYEEESVWDGTSHPFYVGRTPECDLKPPSNEYSRFARIWLRKHA